MNLIYCLYVLINYIIFLSHVSAVRNKFIRVDGLNPTCFKRDFCRVFTVAGAVISVDKSLPYMGSNMCCLTFEIENEDLFNENGLYPAFMTHVLNSTQLEGEDFISIFEGDQFSDKLIKNITANDQFAYDPIFLNTSRITFEIYKDKAYRSTFEIVISAYHEGESPVCKSVEGYHRCGTKNTSYCIDEELLCDKFPHCLDESDESEACGNPDPSLHYDKLTIGIVIGFFMLLVMITMVLIFLLCFFRGKEQLTNTFISIFGQPMGQEESKLYYRYKLNEDPSFDKENQMFIMNEKKKSFRKSLRKSIRKV